MTYDIRLAFYSDDAGVHTGIWDQLRRAYAIAEIYEIGGDPANANARAGWYVVPSVDDVPGVHVAFSPHDSFSPGSVDLADFRSPGAMTLLFGANHRSNAFAAPYVVAIPTPGGGSLWSFTAAAIALHHLTGGADG